MEWDEEGERKYFGREGEGGKFPMPLVVPPLVMHNVIVVVYVIFTLHCFVYMHIFVCWFAGLSSTVIHGMLYHEENGGGGLK